QDTDCYVFKVLTPDLCHYMKSAKEHTQWTNLVTQSLQKIHAHGITHQQIKHTLTSMPFHPEMTYSISKLKVEGNTMFFCLSNANSVFINTILNASPYPPPAHAPSSPRASRTSLTRSPPISMQEGEIWV
ncbi:hypothetical protein H0H87_001136, partial [Tephrocybe sp. NHM501043]